MPAIIIAIDQTHELHHCAGSCFDSVETTCRCLCGGRNHGLGLHAALEQNRLWLEKPYQFQLPDGRPVEPVYIATTPTVPGEPIQIFRPAPDDGPNPKAEQCDARQ